MTARKHRQLIHDLLDKVEAARDHRKIDLGLNTVKRYARIDHSGGGVVPQGVLGPEATGHKVGTMRPLAALSMEAEHRASRGRHCPRADRFRGDAGAVGARTVAPHRGRRHTRRRDGGTGMHPPGTAHRRRCRLPVTVTSPLPRKESGCYRLLSSASAAAGCRYRSLSFQLAARAAYSASVSSRERIRKRTPSGASREKPAPRPGTTSMVRWVCFQYSN